MSRDLENFYDDARAIHCSRIKKGAPSGGYLLLGPEAYERRRVKEALLAAFPEGRSMTQHDLTEITLAEILDDARALSLFASERLIWIVNAEAALPRGTRRRSRTTTATDRRATRLRWPPI